MTPTPLKKRILIKLNVAGVLEKWHRDSIEDKHRGIRMFEPIVSYILHM